MADHKSSTELTLKLSDVIWREDLYPRIETSARTVQQYAADLSVLPPIEVNQRHEIIDGWHRWTAHKKAGAETIHVVVTNTKTDGDLLELAIARNATHGLQLSQEDKQTMARRIYAAAPDRDREACKKRLATLLSVSDRTIRDWLSRIDKDAKEARDRRIFDRWLACWTLQEIAAAEDITKETVSEICQKTADLPKPDKAAAEHATDFEAPVYNVWRQQQKTPGSSHFGNTETSWLDNLLYLYTDPFDVVIDPFAGGGSTIDLCRTRFRRYFVSDLSPIVEREKEIRQHDVGTGLLKPPTWKDVRLVYLDPPYWKQAQGRYGDGPTDLSNMDLAMFTSTMMDVVTGYAAKIKGYIALVIQPTQWNAPERAFTDHIADLIRLVKLPIDMRFSAPYETQQCTAQMVEWAKAHKRCLVLTREIVVWRVQ